MKNLKKLTRKHLELISGGDTAYAFCLDGTCPPVSPGYSSYCSGDFCFKSYNGGGGSGSGGCSELKRFCQDWETGCGCVYF